MGLGVWALEPEKASTGWIGWMEGNREKEKRHFLIKSKKKDKETTKRTTGLEKNWVKEGSLPPPAYLFVLPRSLFFVCSRYYLLFSSVVESFQ